MYPKCIPVSKELSNILAQQEENVDHRLRCGVKACESIVKFLESKLSKSKCNTRKSKPSKKNRTELESFQNDLHYSRNESGWELKIASKMKTKSSKGFCHRKIFFDMFLFKSYA